MGVRSVSALAHLAPERVAGLVLVDLGFAGLASGGLGDALTQFFPKMPRDGFADRSELKAFLAENCPDESIARYLNAASLASPTTGRIVFPFQSEVLLKIITQSKDSTISPWIRGFADTLKPVLVLRGESSRVWKASDYERETEDFKNYASVQFKTYENAGHGLPFDQKARFIEDLKEMISS